MSAFVQINLELWDAWRIGEVSTEERDLGLYVAFESDFRTGQVTRTLSEIGSGMRWTVSSDTVSRRLNALREAGFVAYDVTPRQRRAYVIRPTERLLRAGRLAQKQAGNGTTTADRGVTDAVVTAAPTTADDSAQPASENSPPAAATTASEEVPIREEKRRDLSTQTAPQDPRTADKGRKRKRKRMG